MKRALPIIAILLLTLLAAGSAAGINLIAGSLIAPEEGSVQAMDASDAVASAGEGTKAVERGGRQARVRVKSELEYLNTIMGRNIFDPEAIAEWNPATAVGGGGGGQAVTDLKIRLIGTMVATPEIYSSALIADENGKEDMAFGYNIGDKIEDAEIIQIADKMVKLRRGDGREETLTVAEEVSDKKRSSGGSKAGTSGEGGVEDMGDGKFAVDRSLLEKHIGDIEGISRMGRALLHRGPDGEFDGYRLSAIRRNTIADQLGIKNGDVVHTVNGQPLTSVQNAMNAYNGMMNEDSFSFEVTRRGQKMTLEYEIR